MPLTIQQNGEYVGGTPNTILASWWNDYHDLLTGTMTDQPVTLRTAVRVRALGGGPGAATLTTATGTALGIGSYQYRVTFVDADGGETIRGAVAAITTTSGNQVVNITAIPVGSTGTVSRNLYRTAVGGSTFLLLTTINDNTTTTFTDTTTDASLGTQQPPTHPLFGGLRVTHYTGADTMKFFTDGAVWFDTGAITSDGSGNLTVASIGDTSGSAGLTVHDSGSGIEFKPNTSNRGLIFAYRDSGGAIHDALTLDTSGNLNGLAGTGIPTTRNGAALSVPIFTGTTTPTNPPTGSIWIQA